MKPIEEVTMLYEITKALNAHLVLKKSLYKVLDILSNSMNMVRGTITILNPMRNEIRIEVAHGLTRNAMERVKYKLGEGITGRVIETGKATSFQYNEPVPNDRWFNVECSRMDGTAHPSEKTDRLYLLAFHVYAPEGL